MSRGLDCFHSSYVYRVLRPNEDPNSDLTCCAPRSVRTISQHVATGLRDPSRYISTTSSRDKALKWIETANEKSSWRYGNKRTVIVKIDVEYIKTNCPRIADSAYDLTNNRNRNRFLETDKERKFSCAYNEVVFKDRIPSEAVSIEYIHGKGLVSRNKPVSSSIQQRHKQVASNIYSGFDSLDYSSDTVRTNVSNSNLFSAQSTSVPSKIPDTYAQGAINVSRTIQTTTATPSVITHSFEYNEYIVPQRETIIYSQDTEVKRHVFSTDSTSVASKIPDTAYSKPAINVPRTTQTTAKPSIISPSFEYNVPPREINKSIVKVEPPSASPRYAKPTEMNKDQNISPPGSIYTNYPGRITERKTLEIDQVETVLPRSYPNIRNKESIITASDNYQSESSLSVFRLCCCLWCF